MKRTRSEIAIQAAAETNMIARVWKGADETRVYLSRRNAAQTEAGYIRLYKKEGKLFSGFVTTGSGKGSRTAHAEGQSTFAYYKALWKAEQSATA